MAFAPISPTPVVNFGPELSGTNRVGEQVTVYAEATLSPTHYKFQKYLDGVASGAAVVQTSMPYDYTLLIGDKDKTAKWGVSASTDSVTYGTEAFTAEIFVQSATRAAPVLARTSADNDLPMTWTSYLADGYPGDVRRRQLSSNDTFTTLQFDGQKEVTVTELESPFVSDWSAVDGYPVATSPLYVREMLYTSEGVVESGWSNVISSEAASTFAIWNSSDIANSPSLSGGGLVITIPGSGGPHGVRSDKSSTGKFYYEFRPDTMGATHRIGVMTATAVLSSWAAEAQKGQWETFGGVQYNGGGDSAPSWTEDAWHGVAVDDATDKMWVRKASAPSTWCPSGDPAAGTGGMSMGSMGSPKFAFFQGEHGGVITTNFGATAFAMTAPTGFGNL